MRNLLPVFDQSHPVWVKPKEIRGVFLVPGKTPSQEITSRLKAMELEGRGLPVLWVSPDYRIITIPLPEYPDFNPQDNLLNAMTARVGNVSSVQIQVIPLESEINLQLQTDTFKREEATARAAQVRDRAAGGFLDDTQLERAETLRAAAGRVAPPEDDEAF